MESTRERARVRDRDREELAPAMVIGPLAIVAMAEELARHNPDRCASCGVELNDKNRSIGFGMLCKACPQS